MDFNFSKINLLKHSSDIIFDLLLKYGVNDGNSLEIVKDYLKNNPARDTSQGIRLTKVYAPDVKQRVLERLEENKDYVKKMEEVLDKSLLKSILTQNKGISSALEKLAERKEVVYLTPYGVVRLKEKDCKEFHNPNLDALYYNVMLVCLYNLDQRDTEDKRVTD